MKNWLAPLIAAFALSPLAALAHCAEETLVQCQIGKSKSLEVCISSDERFEYRYGPADKPDMALSSPFSAGTVNAPWHGVGRAITGSVDFQNGPYTYRVWHSYDRLDSENGFSAGVSVFENEQSLSDLICNPSPAPIIAPPLTLEDRMEAAGYCYSDQKSRWLKGQC